MGCLNACICTGNCLRCGSYKKEEYDVQAKDLFKWIREQTEAYYAEMYARHEQEMQEMFERVEQ